MSAAAGRARRRVLSVAGSDPTGGAGVQADLKTLEAMGASGSSVVTALTVQDGRRVSAIKPVPVAIIEQQLSVVARALDLHAIKSGMLGAPSVVELLARFVKRTGVPLIVDPVVAATGGGSLGGAGVLRAIATHLLPVAACVTPNIGEAEQITGGRVGDVDAMRESARAISELGPPAVVVKGGHLEGRPVDVVWDGRRMHTIERRRIAQRDMHGTGCAFASALAARRAQGASWKTAAEDAGDHVASLIAAAVRGRNGVWFRR